MVVEDIASMPERKSPFISDQPKAWATIIPMVIMEKTIVMAAMIGAIPILSIFLKEKSSPNANKRNITPMSDHVLIFSLSTTDIINGILGDIKTPAIIYPKTKGCFSFLNTNVTKAAVTSIKAKSCMRDGISCIYSFNYALLY